MPASPGLNGEGPLVLVAEDEAIIALELEDSLTAAGFRVAGPFSTCAEAEAWLKAGEPDAAILDNQLKDGPCDTLAADLSWRGVPLVIFSGHDDQRDVWAPGLAARWLTKPLNFPALLAALQEQMSERAQTSSG